MDRRRWVIATALSILWCQAAGAQGIVGHWLANGATPTGAPFVEELMFQPNGQVQLQLSIANGPNSGVTRCVGRYGFDGTNLQSKIDACQMCTSYGCSPAPPQLTGSMALSGPVQFNREMFMEFGGLRFSRQR